MNDFEQKNKLEQKIKASLDENVTNLDADTRKQLADIRRQALSGQTNHSKPTRWLALSHWLPTTSLAFGVLLALFFVAQHKQQNHVESSQDQVAVFEMLNNADDLDALGDPDFYLWADEQLANESGHAV